MQIIVRNHAIRRYRARCFDFISSDKQIIELMEKAAMEGKVVRRKHYQTYEVDHRGLFIIIGQESEIITVYTCLGTQEYRRWIRKEDKKRPLVKSGHKKIFNSNYTDNYLILQLID